MLDFIALSALFHVAEHKVQMLQLWIAIKRLAKYLAPPLYHEEHLIWVSPGCSRRFRFHPWSHDLPPGTGMFYEQMDGFGRTVESSHCWLWNLGKLPGITVDRRATRVAVHSGRAAFYAGSPPGEGKPDRRRRLPSATLLIWERRQQGIYLTRFTERGRFAGQTWHPDESSAQEQCAFEFVAVGAPWLALHSEGPVSIRELGSKLDAAVAGAR